MSSRMPVVFSILALISCSGNQGSTGSGSGSGTGYLAVPARGNEPGPGVARPAAVDEIARNAERMFDQGREIFRYDTFGDEAFWGDTLRLHLAIAGAANGGVGAGVSPKAALGVG